MRQYMWIIVLSLTCGMAVSLNTVSLLAQEAEKKPAANAPDKTSEAKPTPAVKVDAVKADSVAKEEVEAKDAATDSGKATPAKAESNAGVKDAVVKPAAEPVKVEAEVDPLKARNIRFQFDGMPYDVVIKRFAQMVKKPILGDVEVDGQLTFFDTKLYNYEEALDTLNLILGMQGQMIIEQDRFLRVVPVADIGQLPITILSGIQDIDKATLRPGEIVTVMIPVKHVDVEATAKALVPMVSIIGKISPMVKADGILITDRISSIRRIRSMVRLMDVEPEDPDDDLEMKLIILERAGATSVAQVINTLVVSAPSSRSRTPVPSNKLRATADDRTNTILLRGVPDKIKLAEEIVKMLDEIDPEKNANIKVFEMKTAAPADVSAALLTMFNKKTGGSGTAFIYGDTTMNSVIVRAGFEDMQLIESLINTLDKNVKSFNNIQGFKFKHTSAAAVKPLFDQILSPRDARGARTSSKIAISVDEGNNMIYVSGTTDTLALAKQLADDVDKDSHGDARQIHILTLKEADATTMATTLTEMYQQLVGEKPAPGMVPLIKAMPSRNTILVSGTDDQWKKVTEFVEQVKGVSIPVDDPVTRIVPLNHADAATVATVLATVGPAAQKKRPGLTPTPITVTASTHNNSLVIVASNEDHKMLAEVLQTIDVEPTENVNPFTIVKLKSGNAAKVTELLQTMVKADRRAEGVVVQADIEANAILLRAPQSKRQILMDMISKLDDAAKTNIRELRTFTLKHASASGLAAMFATLYPATDPKSKTIITSAPGDRTLLVESSIENLKNITDLITSLDKEDAGYELQVRTYDIKKSNAQQLVSALATLYANRSSSSSAKRAGKSVPEPRFSADGTTNKLLVAALPEQFEDIEKTVKAIEDGAENTSITKTYMLEYADSEQVLPILETMIKGESNRSSRNSYSRWSSFDYYGGGGSTGQTQEEIRMAAMPAINGIVVSASAKTHTLVEQLLKTFDTEKASGNVVIEIVFLQNAQAVSLAEAVQLVMSSKKSSSSSSSYSPYGSRYSRSGSDSSDKTTLSISPEPNSNSVMVRGTAKEVKEVVEMIKRLDQQSDSGISQVRIFNLKQAEAEPLSKTLGEMFSDIIKQQKTAKDGRTPPPFVVTADARTNSLVISTTPGLFTLVESILQTLDKEPDKDNRDVQYFVLENADAFDMADQIEQMYIERKGNDKPVVQYDFIGNALTVIAMPNDLETIGRLISKVDAAAKDTSVRVRVVPLTGTKAAKMAEVLKRIYEQTSNDKVTIKKSKSSAEAVLEGLKEKGSEGDTGTAGEEPAVETEEPSEEASKDVSITVDESTNSLILRGSGVQLDQLESLIFQLAGTDDDPEADFKIFTIKNTDTQVVADTITKLFNPTVQAQNQARQNQQQQLLQQAIQNAQSQGVGNLQQLLNQAQGNTQNNQGNQENNNNRNRQRQNQNNQGNNNQGNRNNAQAKPVMQNVIVVPDVRTSRIIVRAKPTDMDLIEKLVEQIDQPSTSAGAIRVFTLKHTQAKDVAANLNELLLLNNKSRTSSGPQVLLRSRIQQKLHEAGIQGGADPIDMQSVISISANVQTNSVIVAAPAEVMVIVTEMVEEIDQSAMSNMPVVQMYKLENIDSNTITSNLKEIFASLLSAKAGNNGLVIASDPGANMVIVSGTAEHQALVATVIKDIDGAQLGDKLSIRVYPVRNADASSIADTLSQSLMPGATQSSNRGQIQFLRGPRNNNNNSNVTTANPSLRITADVSSNTLVVRATDEDHGKIAKLLEEVDIAPTSQQPVKIIAVKNANAEQLAEVLTRMFTEQSQLNRFRRGNGAQSIVIEGSSESNMLLVRSDEDSFERIKQLAEQLDVASPAGQIVQKIIQLKHADASLIANTLQQAFEDTGVTGSAPRTQFNPRNALRSPVNTQNDKVTIVAESGSNSLIVAATEENHLKVASLVRTLDTPESSSTVNEFLLLKNVTARELATALNQMAQGQASNVLRNNRNAPANGSNARNNRIVISADNSSNAILFAGSSLEVDKYKKIAQQLDLSHGASSTSGVFMIPIKNGRASEMASVIQNLFTQKVLFGGGSGPNTPDFAVSADERSNTLIVATDPVTFIRIEALVKQVDNTIPDRGTMRVITLKHLAPSELERAIQQLYGITPSASQANPNQPNQPNTGNNRPNTGNTNGNNRNGGNNAIPNNNNRNITPGIIPGGNGNIIPGGNRGGGNRGGGNQGGGNRGGGAPRGNTSLELSPTDIEHAMIPVQVQNNPAPTRKLNPSTVIRTGSGQVSVTTLPQQRSLLIQADDEDFRAIQQLALMMDQAAEKSQRKTAVVILKHISNTRIAQSLNQIFTASARTGIEDDRVTITPIEGSDAVVISAVESKLPEVQALISQLDTKETTPNLDFKVYALKHSTPSKVLPTIERLLQTIQPAVGNDRPIQLQADDRTKTLIVTARANLFDQIGKIILSLDMEPAYADANLLVIPLKRADATRLAGILRDMIQPDAQEQVTAEARALQEQVKRLNIMSEDGKKQIQLDLTKPIKITADPIESGNQGLNALVISSTDDNLKALQAIVQTMDRFPLSESLDVKIVHLNHADAQTVSDTLTQIFTQAKTLGGKEGTSVEGKAEPEDATGKALLGGFTITPDPRTNAVVLSGRPESLDLAVQVISDLDRENSKFITEVKLFKLKHAEAAALAPLLSAVFAETESTVPGAAGLRTQVTRLRTALEKANQDKLQKDDKDAKDKNDGNGKTTEIARAREALSIQADESSQTLIVAAHADVMPLIADVIKGLDIPGAGAGNLVQFVPLKQADATRIKQVIDELYTGQSAENLRNVDIPTVSVDTRTNSLVISTSEKTFELLTGLINKLDVKLAIDLRDIKIIQLKNAEATALAATLQQMMDARVQRQESLGVKDAESYRMIVIADPRSNALVVGGSTEGFQLVESLAKELDDSPAALSGQIQLFPLKHANSGTLSTTLTQLFTERYQAATTADVQRQKPIILPDLRSNALLVAANQDDTKVLISLLKRMDVELTDPAVIISVINMKHNDAGVVGPTIQRLFAARLQAMTAQGQTPAPQDEVSVETDALANALIISASKENLKLIQDLLSKVDIEPPTETGIVRLYALKNADATRVSTMLQSLISQGLYKPGTVATQNNQAIEARERVAIETDLRTNAVIVSASKENFAVIEEVISKIDSDDAFGLVGDIRIFKIEHADATRLAPTLQQFFNDKRAAEEASGNGAGANALAITVTPDARTNTILVAGSRESYASIEKMLQQLDTEQTLPATTFRVFKLKAATASAIQPTVQELFTQRAVRGTDTDAVTVLADNRANALIVGATPNDMRSVESLLLQLDVTPAVGASMAKVIPITKADANQVATTIRNLYTPQTGNTNEQSPTISVDERSNAILVTAGSADLKRIEELVKQLDTESVTRVTEIRVFTLDNADSEELATLLTETLTQKPEALTEESPNRQNLIQLITRDENDKEMISRALQEGILVNSDRRSNSIIVSAPLDYMPLLGRLIKKLDNTSPREAQIKVFNLTNSDAQQMANVLTQLFGLENATPDSERAVKYTLVAPSGEGKATATIGSAEKYALTVTVDIRTNSLLVGGTKLYLGLVTDIIQKLDDSPAQERRTEIYNLRHTQAPDIATTLQTFLDQERDRITQTLGDDAVGAAQRLLEREVSIVAEESSNTLLVSASPRYYETIDAMIKKLDSARPQVLIQVTLAEVSLDDSLNLGFEWNYRKGIDEAKIETGTDFGVSNDLATNGGFGVSLTGGDVNFTLRALQAQGKVEILSRPQILASNNQPASINVGQRVPFITQSRVTDEGNTVNTIQYEDVGVILDVTARMTEDGFVHMDVNPEISSIAETGVQISETVNAIVINNRSAETSVTVQDGHTIIIGGLITSEDIKRDRKFPGLGDIPVIGELFKDTANSKKRTELLIIMTPHIIRTPEEADRITREEQERYDMIKSKKLDEKLEEFPWKDLNGDKSKVKNIKVTPSTKDTPRNRPDKPVVEVIESPKDKK